MVSWVREILMKKGKNQREKQQYFKTWKKGYKINQYSVATENIVEPELCNGRKERFSGTRSRQ